MFGNTDLEMSANIQM